MGTKAAFIIFIFAALVFTDAYGRHIKKTKTNATLIKEKTPARVNATHKEMVGNGKSKQFQTVKKHAKQKHGSKRFLGGFLNMLSPTNTFGDFINMFTGTINQLATDEKSGEEALSTLKSKLGTLDTKVTSLKSHVNNDFQYQNRY